MEISSFPILNNLDDFFYNDYSFSSPEDIDSTLTKKQKTDSTNNTNNNSFSFCKSDEELLSFQDIISHLFTSDDNPIVTSQPEISYQTFQITNENTSSHKRAREEPVVHDELFSIGNGGSPQSQRKLWVKNRSKEWWEQRDSLDYPDEEFKKVFRMSKATFNMICKELELVVNKKDTMLRLAIPVRQRVAVCIYRLATGEPLREVSKRFGLGISTCHKLVLEVCKAIQEVLKPKYVQWPNVHKTEMVKREFEMISGIPNVCGSLYTTHIPIIAPKEKTALYFNKRYTERNQKTSYTISVQGTVNTKRVFTDVSIGWPGSFPDDKVLEKSSITHRANAGVMKNATIVGNSGHPLMDWIMVPYPQQNVNWAQHMFNEKIGEVQGIAKEAFMRLKARWTCLQKRTEMKLQDLPVVIMACCVLHNICEINNEELSPELKFELFDDEMVAENVGRSVNALNYRDEIAHKLLHHNFAGTNISYSY